jgi:exopolysaccharide production protein ExoZ
MNLGLRRGLIVLSTFFFASIAAGVAAGGGRNAITHVVTNTLLLEFLIGAWIGYAFIDRIRMPARAANFLLIFGGVWFGSGLIIGFSRLPSLLTWGIASGFTIAGLVFRERASGADGVLRGLAPLGDGSYSIYLLHILVLDVILIGLDRSFHSELQILYSDSLSPILSVIALTVVSVSVGLFAYQALERRVLIALHALYKRCLADAPRRQTAP